MWTHKRRMLAKNIVLVCILIGAFLVIQQTTGGKNLFSQFLSDDEIYSEEPYIIIPPPSTDSPPPATRPPSYHLACNSSKQCVKVKGFEDDNDLCNNDAFCKDGGHFKCEGPECTPKNGVGEESECENNYQCALLDDPGIYIIPSIKFPPKQK